MSNATSRTISLEAGQAEYIDQLVASGAFASESDVISAAISALKMQDTGLDAAQEQQVLAAEIEIQKLEEKLQKSREQVRNGDVYVADDALFEKLRHRIRPQAKQA
jgi:Arc/MetJ-type ribon-helix-helix transcriptional regulator